MSDRKDANLHVQLSPQAIVKIRQLTCSRPGHVLRLSVSRGGCAGYEYQLEITLPKKEDILIQVEDVRIAVDPASSPLLSGTTLDYKDGLTQGGFRVINPQAKSTCGCGSSFQP